VSSVNVIICDYIVDYSLLFYLKVAIFYYQSSNKLVMSLFYDFENGV